MSRAQPNLVPCIIEKHLRESSEQVFGQQEIICCPARYQCRNRVLVSLFKISVQTQSPNCHESKLSFWTVWTVWIQTSVQSQSPNCHESKLSFWTAGEVLSLKRDCFIKLLFLTKLGSAVQNGSLGSRQLGDWLWTDVWTQTVQTVQNDSLDSR